MNRRPVYAGGKHRRSDQHPGVKQNCAMHNPAYSSLMRARSACFRRFRSYFVWSLNTAGLWMRSRLFDRFSTSIFSFSEIFMISFFIVSSSSFCIDASDFREEISRKKAADRIPRPAYEGGKNYHITVKIINIPKNISSRSSVNGVKAETKTANRQSIDKPWEIVRFFPLKTDIEKKKERKKGNRITPLYL